MDDLTCHYTSSTQAGEEAKALCEKTLHRLFRAREKLDQPLINFTREDIYELAEQFRSIVKAMHSLSAETLSQYIRSSDITFRSLQNTIIDLNLALDQLSSSRDKAVFYRYLLSSQEHFGEIFIHGLTEAAYTVSVGKPLAPVIDLPRRSTSNYKAMADFAHIILPGLCALFRSNDVICSEECEQAIADMKKAEDLFERQASLLRAQHASSWMPDEGAALHCKLGVVLAYAGELTKKLIHLLTMLQSRCHSQSKQTMRRREEIEYYLTLLSHQSEDLLQKTRELNALQDQARFRYRGLGPSAEDLISLQR